MKSFLVALQFLTALPVRFKKEPSPASLAGSIRYYPLVGILIGLGLVAVHAILSYCIPSRLVVSALLVTAGAVMTRGLHLDGLADTMDAFFSNTTPPRMLEIMKDPHIGTMGTLALICVVLVKIAVFSTLSLARAHTALLLAGLLSRYSMVVLMSVFPYAREEGTAKAYLPGADRATMWSASCMTMAGAWLIFSVPGLLFLIAVIVGTVLWGLYSQRMIKGITGDIIGAGCEGQEAILLIAVSMWEAIG